MFVAGSCRSVEKSGEGSPADSRRDSQRRTISRRDTAPQYQHPHKFPFGAGYRRLPYYTMPFLEGESLRAINCAVP